MKVFISHKKEDSITAFKIQNILKSLKIESYLDLLDTNIASSGEFLTKHIKNNLNKCSDILVVLSEETKKSWWVPFEIGMASQIDMPIVNYLKSGIDLPEYLSYWPRLKNDDDISKYVDTRILVNRQVILERSGIHKYAGAESETERFYATLKKTLK